MKSILLKGGIGVFLLALMSSAAYAQGDSTGRAGGNGGNAFSLSCAPNEVLAGVLAYGGTYVNSIRLKCVKVDQGKWAGDVIARGYAGGGGGQPSDLMCGKDEAVSGLQGKAGTFIDRLQLQCRPLDPARPRRTTGARKYTYWVGGDGGQRFGPLDCPNDKPVFKVAGKAGQWLDSLEMLCQ